MRERIDTNLTEARVVEILECYGSDPACWPDVDRKTVLEMISSSEQLQKRQIEAQRLDELLNESHELAQEQCLKQGSMTAVTGRILSDLPKQLQVDQVAARDIAYDRKRYTSNSGYYATAASIVMICVMLVAIFTNFNK